MYIYCIGAFNKIIV